MTQTYRHTVADQRRRYPHQVKLANGGGWRDRLCAHKAREVMPGPLVQWFEGPGSDRLWTYGFKTSAQAATFRAWSKNCGINWRVVPELQALYTRPPSPPEGPVATPAVHRIAPKT